MKSTGEVLKQRREQLKISLAEVSIATKITSRMLQAIEAGDLEYLPARTFLRGFVKSYASFLKMDVEQVLRLFNEEMNVTEAPPLSPVAEPEPAPEKSARQTMKEKEPLFEDGASIIRRASLTVGMLGLVALVVFVYRMVEKYEREGQVQEPPPSLSQIAPQDETKPNSDVPSGAIQKPELAVKPEETPKPEVTSPAEVVGQKPEEAAKPDAAQPVVAIKPDVVPKPDVAAKPDAAPKPEVIAKPEVIVKPEVVPKTDTLVKPGISPTTEIAAKPEATPKPEVIVKPEVAPRPEATAKPEAATSVSQEIIIEALDKVDITFSVGKGQEKKVSLQPDQVQTIKAAGAVAIELSDGGAVNIIHNGRDLGVPGDLGRPKKIQLP